MWVILPKVLATDSPEPISASALMVARAVVQAKRSNGAAVLMGDITNLAVGVGFELSAPDASRPLDKMEMLSGNGVGNNLNLSSVYLLGSIGEGVNVYYEIY